MAIFNGSKDVTYTAGDTIPGNRIIRFTVITNAVLTDGEGNTFGSYEAGTSVEGLLPRGTFTLSSGSIKVWA